MAENIETNPLYDFTKLIHDNSEATMQKKINALADILTKVYPALDIITRHIDDNLTYLSNRVNELNYRTGNLETRVNYLAETVTKLETTITTTNTQPQPETQTKTPPPTETKTTSTGTLRGDLVKELQRLFNERKLKEKNE